MRLTRFFIACLFIFLFAFGIQNEVFAQAADQQCSLDAVGAAQIQVCKDCRNDVPTGHANDPICKHWIDSWGNSAALASQITDVAAAISGGKCKTTLQQPPVSRQTHSVGVENDLLGGTALLVSSMYCKPDGTVVLGTPRAGEAIAFAQTGVLGTLSEYTGNIAVIPVSSTQYIAYVKDSIQHPFAQPAYAQGLGFSSLAPVLGLWKLFRNLSYFFFVIIFLIIGFMIMFRSKIGGQAAVTVQQALPKIIVSLLLVTFSYAIAGLMIDLMYLIIYLMIGIFSAGAGAGSVLSVASLTEIAFSKHIFDNVFTLIGASKGGVVNSIGVSISGAVSQMLNNSGWDANIAKVVGLGANIIFTLVMLIAILVNMFRIFFALLQAYVMVIFSVVFAPIQLLMGALPGQNTFSAWFKGLWQNLLAFPVVIFFLLCAQYFTSNNFGTAQGGFAAPQLGLQKGVSGTFILAIMQFGILALIPKAIEIAKDLANGKLNIDPGKAMGEMWKQGGGSALTKAAILSPVAGVGAIAGYKYATNRANKLGLEGNARKLAQVGGILGGGGIGLNLPSTVKHVVPAAFRQLAQTQVTESSKELRQAAESRRAEAETLRQNQLLAQQKQTQEASAAAKPTAPVGPKSNRMNEMRP